jgi:Zn-dependent protease with chaperone function
MISGQTAWFQFEQHPFLKAVGILILFWLPMTVLQNYVKEKQLFSWRDVFGLGQQAAGLFLIFWLAVWIFGDWWWLILFVMGAIGLMLNFFRMVFFIPPETKSIESEPLLAPVCLAIQERTGACLFQAIAWLDDEAAQAMPPVVVFQKTGILVLNRELFRNLTPVELEAVLLHETAHLYHGRSLLGMLFGLLFKLFLVTYGVHWLMVNFVKLPLSGSGFYANATFLVLATFLIATGWELWQQMKSRARECEADFFAMAHMQTALPMMSALRKVDDAMPEVKKGSLISLSFVQSHPPLEERLRYLEYWQKNLC